ncbi:hypothetical protein O4J56_04075 [Nocardiopsis sp. RSe5-2]|uniref:Uncharacterized protein n=1 Tax=Nocardiopsis endophytica TaxID=3018445 RepID=A0ABT4TYN5_9ACTN|nr:hypothetical protein [Nocardiopsis endophytica]MDA2809808.1 hypothetical protein [Nocardiopsis endophytica]
MADLLWEGVEDLFDGETAGPLPDLRVPGATADGWQALLELVVERGWRHRYAEDGSAAPLPSARTALARRTAARWPELRVWPAEGLLAVFRFESEEDVDFDIDVREIRGQESLDALCGFLGAIGRRLRRPVLMAPEGGGAAPVLRFDPAADRVVRTDGRS